MAINAERLFETAQEALRLACIDVHDGDEKDGNGLYNLIVKDPETFYRGDAYYLRKALPALEIYITAKEELGRAKGGTAYSAYKRIIKRVGDWRKDLKGVWTDADGRCCVCDGYVAVRLNKPVDGFDGVDGIDLEKVFPNGAYFTDPVELAIPTPGELKIKSKKISSGSKVYDFGEGLPLVNAAYLKDVMDCLPGAKAVTESGSTTKMIYFTSDKGDAILLPIRKSA